MSTSKAANKKSSFFVSLLKFFLGLALFFLAIFLALLFSARQRDLKKKNQIHEYYSIGEVFSHDHTELRILDFNNYYTGDAVVSEPAEKKKYIAVTVRCEKNCTSVSDIQNYDWILGDSDAYYFSNLKYNSEEAGSRFEETKTVVLVFETDPPSSATTLIIGTEDDERRIFIDLLGLSK